MRILFSGVPLYGHVNTLIPLAMAARRRGHDVVFATGADLVPHIQARGLSAGAIRAEIEAMPDADAVLSALTESDVASARRGSRPRRLASSS